ncbi:MAG: glycosyltransferase [Desulfovibrio sp.]|uniref:glycosyltransferase n=1 Tax=Desulfovibrio sp. TaxID=885 RepID=UPI0025C32F9F|nr:glycosyltransferase [Desulfovibrio sp.]MCI7568397.1 glycosyltransferase [Desulfovibrio sp.]
MFVFTSCTNNYIPKARVLASSLKRFHPDWEFCLLLGEAVPEGFSLENEPFDRIVFFDQLGIPDYESWLFRHRVVEICTAAKGPAAYRFLVEEEHEKVIYLDPDIMVCNSLAPLEALLDEHDILLTPHQRLPQHGRAIEDNERVALKYGIFNLGFLGLARRKQGMEFASWWRDRLLQYCYDDIPNGLFTDQRWCDMAPAFFPRLHILRDPGYNAASWNLTERHISRSADGVYMADDVPLRFYHFTGFDSGAGRGMTARYAVNMPAIFDLWADYTRRLEACGQGELGRRPWKYLFFDNGARIEDAMRLEYRRRPDLQRAFPDPFATPGYLDWFIHEMRQRRRACSFAGRWRNFLARQWHAAHAEGGVRLLGHKAARRLGGILSRYARAAWRRLVPAKNTTPQASLEALLRSSKGRSLLEGLLPASAGPVLLVEHDWGGGAAAYIQERAASLLRAGHPVLRLKYSLARHDCELVILSQGARFHCSVEHISTLAASGYFHIAEVIVNELAGWYCDKREPYDAEVMKSVMARLEEILCVAQANHASLEYLFHDFYAICPRINCVDAHGSYCELQKEDCEGCLEHDGGSVWRSHWKYFLERADRIIFFSDSSLKLVQSVLNLPAGLLKVQPHRIDDCFFRKIDLTKSDSLRIAVVGDINLHKGAFILLELARLLQRKRPDAQIIVFGRLLCPETPPANIQIRGPYRREDLPVLLEQDGINMAVFLSIWPETFSFVVHELAALGVPVAAFNLGAQGECVGRLDVRHGRLAKEMTAESLLSAIEELASAGKAI